MACLLLYFVILADLPALRKDRLCLKKKCGIAQRRAIPRLLGSDPLLRVGECEPEFRNHGIIYRGIEGGRAARLAFSDCDRSMETLANDSTRDRVKSVYRKVCWHRDHNTGSDRSNKIAASRSQRSDNRDKKIVRKSTEAPETFSTVSLPKTILWVDDKPSNNAIEISQLEGLGYRIVTALSTGEAITTLARERIGLIISDMGRHEEGRYVPQAGLILLKAAHESGYTQPFVVYSSPKYAERNDAEIKAQGGVGATASPTTLLEWIDTYLVIRNRN